MKTLNEIEGLSLLSKEELNDTNGGFWQYVVAGLLYLASEFDSIKDGVQDALNNEDYNYE
jgi:hypothetical protein